MTIEIAPFVPAESTGRDVRELYELSTAVTSAEFPEYPLPTFEAYSRQTCAPATAGGPHQLWTCRVAGRLAATATLVFPDRENLQVVVATVRVAPDLRRRGVGTALLRALLPEIRRRGRTAVVGHGMKIGRESERWAAGLGFATVQRLTWQYLVVPEADPRAWRVDLPDGFRIRHWTDAAPDGLVDGFAVARTAIGDAPTGGGSRRFPAWSVERVRQHEADMRAIGEEHRFVVAVHEATGTIAGLTEIAFLPGQTHYCYQEDTAVLPAFRGNGLGRCVKAAMMQWLRADRPGLERVLTTVAADNSYMIDINHRLGYTTTHTVASVEADISALALRLAATPDRGSWDAAAR